jgi:E3 ubiquitin-protein ligase TRIP12
MDLQAIHHPEAESSSSASTALPQLTTHQEPSTSSASGEHKFLRTSARVKAAKQKLQAKGKGQDLDTVSAEEFATALAPTGETSNSRNTRSTASVTRNKRIKDTNSIKGKVKEIIDESLSRSNKRCVACDVLNRTQWLMGLSLKFTSYRHFKRSPHHQRTCERS